MDYIDNDLYDLEDEEVDLDDYFEPDSYCGDPDCLHAPQCPLLALLGHYTHTYYHLHTDFRNM